MIVIGSAIVIMPARMVSAPTTHPIGVIGNRSPYPTVDIVTMHQYIETGMDEKGVGAMSGRSIWPHGTLGSAQTCPARPTWVESAGWNSPLSIMWMSVPKSSEQMVTSMKRMKTTGSERTTVRSSRSIPEKLRPTLKTRSTRNSRSTRKTERNLASVPSPSSSASDVIAATYQGKMAARSTQLRGARRNLLKGITSVHDPSRSSSSDVKIMTHVASRYTSSCDVSPSRKPPEWGQMRWPALDQISPSGSTMTTFPRAGVSGRSSSV
mmetsp:Transcript_21519/g.69464  ORF Transcript_21519/g.69464 Transcript_21519/m.69464 type:complete len:266 (+) Transcript_21519:1475-2272(+)